jgi:hypothetical protein
MSFDGDLYPTAGATSVMTTKGDMVDFDTIRQRLGIGSTNQVLSVTAGLPAWKTLTLADSVLTTAGDVLYENNTPELARLPKGSDADVLTLASGLPSWSAPAGGGSMELIESHTFDGSETAHIFTTDMNFYTTYSDMIVVFHGLTASSTTMSLRTNGRTINYYSTSRKNGTQTDTGGAIEAFVMDGMGGTYNNICIIHCSTALKPAGTFMGANDVGQNVITGGFGNTNSNTDAGILTEFELRFDNAPTSTAQAEQYGVKMT